MFEALLEHPVTLRLGWTLIHSLWQGLILAGLLGLGLLLLDRERNRLRHALASLTLLLWLAAPPTTFLLLAPQAVATVAHSAPTAVTDTPPANPSGTEPREAPRDGTSERVAVALTTTSLADVSQLHRLLPYAALAWLATAALLSLRLLGGLLTVHHLRRNGAPLPRLEAHLRALAARLGVGRRVRLLASTRIDVPTALGWLRPVVLLPASTLTGLTSEQLELILAHELAHIRRKDYLVSILQGVAEALLFYHPLTWWLSHTLRTEREHACDDLALHTTGAAPLELAETLALLESSRPTPSPALAATGSLRRRVRRLLRAAQPAPARAPALLPVLALIPLGLWLALASQPPAPTSSLFERHPDGHLTGPYFEPSEGVWSPVLSLTELSASASFPIHAPTSLPESFRFDNATWNEQLQSAALTYGTADEESADPRPTHFITIMQAPAQAFPPLPVGANATIEPVTVGSAAGEYVTGYWTGDWKAPPADRNLHWEPDHGQLLAWQDRGMVYAIATDQIPITGTEMVSRDELVKMAESLVTIGSAPGTPGTALHLPSDMTRLWATVEGDVTFTPNYSGLTSIGEGGRVTVEERSAMGARRVIVTSDADGELHYHYSENGPPASFHDDAEAWYQRAFSELVLAPLAKLHRDQRAPNYGAFFQLPDRYLSLIGLQGERSYDLDLRDRPDSEETPALIAKLEKLTHAAAHGLIDQGLLEVALSYYLADLTPKAEASFRYAISHLDSEAARQRLNDRLQEQTEDSGG